jgi:hypothetical protein
MFRPAARSISAYQRTASRPSLLSHCRCFYSTTPSAAAEARTTTSTTSEASKLQYSIVPKDDFGQYKEYSVIFTNRALNLMSDPFQKVMRDLNELLKTTYNADKVAIIPGYVSSIVFST